MAKPVMPDGARTVEKSYALTIPEEIRKDMVVTYLGQLMWFDTYCEMQERICNELRAKKRSIPENYWQKYELTKYDDGTVVARKRDGELVAVDGEDGTRKMVATKIANFSYAGQTGLDGRRNGKYNDEDRIIASDLASEPEVKEVAAWVTERE